MESIAEAMITSWETNLMGEWCRECDQIAFRIVSVEESGKTIGVPLCSRCRSNTTARPYGWRYLVKTSFTFLHMLTGPSTLLMNRSAMEASSGISFTPEISTTGMFGHFVFIM